MIGLIKNELKILNQVFKKFENIKKVILFGSRALGTYKTTSDIDLAIKGNVDINTLSKLKYTLEEETTLPYFFDVVIYDNLDNVELKKHIDGFGESIYKKYLFFITKYDKKYLKQIVELFINTVHNINKKDYSKEQLNAWANPNYDLETWEKRFEKSKPHLCMLEDEVVGFCEYYEGYIDCFYIHHNYQNCGIGKLLLTHILELAKNENIDKLKVDASITAKPFFEKFGFKQVKENIVKRENVELVNFSMEKYFMNLN